MCGFGGEGDVRTMFPRNPTGDGKTQTGPVCSAAGGLTTKKPLEYPRELVATDPDARIFDAEGRHLIAHRDLHSHLSPTIGEFHRVVQQDHHQLAHKGLVTDYRRLLEFVESDF